MHHLEALEVCKAEVRRRGFTVSAGAWSDEGRACAFSAEDAGPATSGHPTCSINARLTSEGWQFTHENNPIVGIMGLLQDHALDDLTVQVTALVAVAERFCSENAELRRLIVEVIGTPDGVGLALDLRERLHAALLCKARL